MKFLLLSLVLFADPGFKVQEGKVESVPLKSTFIVEEAEIPAAPVAKVLARRRMYVFGFESCGSCRQSRPALEEFVKEQNLKKHETENSETDVLYIDSQKWPDLAAAWQVESQPVVIVHDNYQVVSRRVGVYTKADLLSLWTLPRAEGFSSSHMQGAIEAAMKDIAAEDMLLPKVKFNPTTKQITLMETCDIPYGKYVTLTTYKDTVIKMVTKEKVTSVEFSKPYPRIRTSPIHWDGYIRSFEIDSVNSKAVIRIDGFPDQTVKF